MLLGRLHADVPLYIAVWRFKVTANWPAAPCAFSALFCHTGVLRRSLLQVVCLTPDRRVARARCDGGTRVPRRPGVTRGVARTASMVVGGGNGAAQRVILFPVLLSSCLGVCFSWFVRRVFLLALQAHRESLVYQPADGKFHPSTRSDARPNGSFHDGCCLVHRSD